MSNPSITTLQQHFHQQLGTEAIRKLHRVNRVYDLGLLIMLPALFALLVAALSSLPLGWLWCVCLVLQGFVLMAFGLAGHEHLHRRLIEGKAARVMDLVLFAPLYRSPTHYEFWHAKHHTHLGTAHDSEQFKTDIDTTWRRIVYATVLGVLFPKLAFAPRPDATPRVYPDASHLAKVLRFEGRVIWVFTFAWVALAVFFPKQVLLGYVLPLLVVTPFASTVRTVIEHSEFDAANPFQLGCFYRTNAFTRVVFLWNSGDCHFVHHIFPRMPFYRVPEALRLMRPSFVSQGVNEYKSLIALTWRWFAQARPYLSPARR